MAKDAIRVVFLDQMKDGKILDILEAEIAYRKDGKFGKELQWIFQEAIRRSRMGMIPFIEYVDRNI